MARHPWVAEADNGIRWGVQLVLGDAGRVRARVAEAIERLRAWTPEEQPVADSARAGV